MSVATHSRGATYATKNNIGHPGTAAERAKDKAFAETSVTDRAPNAPATLTMTAAR